MTPPDCMAAWRLFELNWLPLGAMAAALLVSLLLTDFSLAWGGLVVSFGFVAVYAGFAYYNAKAPHRRDPQIVFVLGSTAQIVLVTALMTPLTYVAAAANFPLQDATLLGIDRALGIDGLAYLAFVDSHPLLAGWLRYGYTMIRWPIFAIPVVLAAAHCYRRMQEFTLAFTLALIATTIASAFVPALGIFSQFDVQAAGFSNLNPVAYFDSLREMLLVRDGSLRRLELLGLKGLVTFPSFHAASAALYTWVLWPVWWMRPVAVIANTMMLASCPVDGAHYVIDLIAGIAVAVLAIIAARRVSAWAARAAERADAAVAATPALAES
jgi:hypothetical protein